MRYRELRPPAALRPLVHRIWLLRGRAPRGGGEFQRAMPDGRPEIVFNLADRFESRGAGGSQLQPAALLVGPTTRAVELRPSGRIDLLGIRLRPGAGRALLGISGAELLDHTCDLDDLRLPWARDLTDQLEKCPDTSERLELVARRLLEAAAGSAADGRLEAAIDLVSRAAGPVQVGAVAGAVGLSRRHLTRLCRERVGMGPKLLGRLARFQRILGELERVSSPRWTRLAVRHGYYDQAHLGRDFRRFAGISPGRYLSAAREVTRHFVDEAAYGRFVQDSPSPQS